MQETFNFETALSHAKAGAKISRLQFRDTCYVVAKYPDQHSQNTLPYLQMIKKVTDGTPNVFPVDLSCESIFAEDWYVVTE